MRISLAATIIALGALAISCIEEDRATPPMKPYSPDDEGGDADGDSDGDSDSDAEGDADGDADGDSDGDGDPPSSDDSDYGEAGSDGDGDSDGDSDADGDLDGDADSDADLGSDEADDCPLSSGYPCACDASQTSCQDGSDCVVMTLGDPMGFCSARCNGEEQDPVCQAQGFGIESINGGLCLMGTGSSTAADHCVLMCDVNGMTGPCPEGLTCADPYGQQQSICVPQ